MTRKPHLRSAPPLARLLILPLCGLVIAGPGCTKTDEISRYRVPKPHVVHKLNHVEGTAAPTARPTAPPSGQLVAARMLAAIIVHDDQAWFFKVMGPADAVGRQADAFRALVKSVRFSESKPAWNLPDGWRQRPGSGMRYASIEIAAEGEPLELTVIPLPTSGGADAADVLANVNRWRGQLSLPPIDAEQLADQREQIELDGATATLVNLVGTAALGGPSGGPFASGAAPFAGNVLAAEAPSSPDDQLSYDTPQGWTPGKAGGLRKAAFLVRDSERQVEITIVDLADAAGELLPNVNRWRDQIGLEATTAQQLRQDAKKIEVDGVAADYVALVGPEDAVPRQTILAVVAIHQDRAWFLKLMGDVELAERERARFDQFVRSVRFTKTQGAGDGN